MAAEQREEFLRDAMQDEENVDDEDRGVVKHVLEQFFPTKNDLVKVENTEDNDNDSDTDVGTEADSQVDRTESVASDRSSNKAPEHEEKSPSKTKREEADRSPQDISKNRDTPTPTDSTQSPKVNDSRRPSSRHADGKNHSRKGSSISNVSNATRTSDCHTHTRIYIYLYIYIYMYMSTYYIYISTTREIQVEEKVRRWRSNGNALAMLKKVEEWDFDVFGLGQLCGKFVMAVVFCTLCERRKLVEELSLNVTHICNFFEQITESYRDNPYHNHLHGVDVLVNCNYFMHAHVFEGLNNLDVLACLVSAACHDVAHPGNNNAFEIAIESDIAVKYNDESVLENMHAAKTWEIMKKPGCNILEGISLSIIIHYKIYKYMCICIYSMLKSQKQTTIKGRSKTERKRFRQLLIQSILATDMSRHKDQMTALTKLIDELHQKGGYLEKWALDVVESDPVGMDRLKEEKTEPATATATATTTEAPGVFDKKAELAGIVVPLAVHTGDLSNPTKTLRIYRQWANRVMDEFYAQGDAEKKLGISVTSAFDRTQTTLPASQTGFINHVIKPWFDLWGELLPEKREGVMFNNNVKLNLEYMKKELERAKKEKETEAQRALESTNDTNSPVISVATTPSASIAPTNEKRSDDKSNGAKEGFLRTAKKAHTTRNVLAANSNSNLKVLGGRQRNRSLKSFADDSNVDGGKGGGGGRHSRNPRSEMKLGKPRDSRSHSILAASAQDIKNAQFEKHLWAMQELATIENEEMDNDFDMFGQDEDPVGNPKLNGPGVMKKSTTQNQLRANDQHNHSPSDVGKYLLLFVVPLTTPTYSIGINLPNLSKSSSDNRPFHRKVRTAAPDSPLPSINENANNNLQNVDV
ncbi:hypothetical protein RFI_12333 [Reticulomyxa filosa]|uniref:Phosphodiesterase n=1 Tax=Reticulomyxa filosa TaxID=46433 RepID=X6NGE2_RETFI|nr:hypothetical protein RFI_12333 [Reticulomyxa filosa]|eukprot:ETO24824.1 hypothetical protein RFI_12333 [Reticulomyxa filosa]